MKVNHENVSVFHNKAIFLLENTSSNMNVFIIKLSLAESDFMFLTHCSLVMQFDNIDLVWN